MTIRLATTDDVQMISTLFTEFFAHNALQQPKYYCATEENGKYPSAVINSQSGDIIVAEIEQMIVGFVHIEEDITPPFPSVVPHKFACIVDFIVSNQYRRNGIGRLLLDEAKRWATARKLEYIELMVLENNVIGRSFYESEDFTTVSQTMRLEV